MSISWVETYPFFMLCLVKGSNGELWTSSTDHRQDYGPWMRLFVAPTIFQRMKYGMFLKNSVIENLYVTTKTNPLED